LLLPLPPPPLLLLLLLLAVGGQAGLPNVLPVNHARDNRCDHTPAAAGLDTALHQQL
jgi:hypothetical protein